MPPTPLSTFLLKILKFRDKKSERPRLTGTSVDKVKVIDMSIGGEEKKDDSRFTRSDQKYMPNNDDTKWMAPGQRSKGNKKRKLTDIDIQINPDQQSDIRRENSNRQRQDNSLLQVALMTLICIIVIDLSIWGYFKYIKGVSFIDGIIGWQTSVRGFLNFQDKPDHPKYIVIQKPSDFPRKQIQNKQDYPKLIVKQQPSINPIIHTEVTSNSEPEIIKNYLYKIDLVNSGKIEGVKLIDKGDSYQIFSKEGIVTEINKGQIKKINRLELEDVPYFETKFINRNSGTIVVPVTVSNNGHKEQIKLILDTGCSTTQIHPDVVNRLEVEINDRGKSVIADGRTIDKFYGTVESFEVGPIEEQNFKIRTNYIENKNGIDGLLGMNFLRNHPFDIDLEKQVVRWENPNERH